VKCLSIHAPWSWAILNAGKNIENRSRPTSYRGPLLIHASKSRTSYDGFTPDSWRSEFDCELPEWDDLVKGAIVGVVDLVGCFRFDPTKPINEMYAKWSEGPYCWILSNPRSFAEPILYRGQQNIFKVDDSLVQDLIKPSE